MTAGILEDELLARNRLNRLIRQSGFKIDIVAQFDRLQDMAEYLIKSENQPDIIFLDIHVSDGHSFELFNVVDVKSKVIFTTAYDQYAVDAFRHSAVDYLLKPIKKDQLHEAISKLSRIDFSDLKGLSSNESFKKHFLIRFGKKLQRVQTNEIAYIFSKNKISYFHTYQGKVIASDFRLHKLEEELDPDCFFRANRQLIVHIDAINEIVRHNSSRLKLVLTPKINEEIIVSTERTKALKTWLD